MHLTKVAWYYKRWVSGEVCVLASHVQRYWLKALPTFLSFHDSPFFLRRIYLTIQWKLIHFHGDMKNNKRFDINGSLRKHFWVIYLKFINVSTKSFIYAARHTLHLINVPSKPWQHRNWKCWAIIILFTALSVGVITIEVWID